MRTHPLLPVGTWYFAQAANHPSRLSCLPKHPDSKCRKEKILVKCLTAHFQEITKSFAELH